MGRRYDQLTLGTFTTPSETATTSISSRSLAKVTPVTPQGGNGGCSMLGT